MSRELENAIVRLLKRRPFYGQFLLNCRKEERGEYPAGVTVRDGIPLVAVNPALFAQASAAEQEALLEHGVKHLLHLHMFRRGERNVHDWDISCDLAINPSIEGLPSGAAVPSDFSVPEGLAAEEYYIRLSSPFDTGNMAGNGIGTAAPDAGGHAGPGGGTERAVRGAVIDDHTIWSDADSTPLRLAEEVLREIVRDASLKSHGELPEDIRPLAEALLKPSLIPWQQVLRQFVATAGRIGRQTTWMREHRRFGNLTPGTRKRHRLNLLVGVDVSDSTDTVELREAFAAELMRIARGRDAQITVLYANSRIRRIDNFRGDAVRAESYHGGGFTDLRPVFQHARSMIPPPAAVVYLTDGIGPAPETMEFPTLWVLTREGERPAPWGVELRLDV
ncbi:VWA-like domain-containing protein [Geobacter sp. DSM 9736]|uniref:vWA domain-containing protein n=1 Tax=Geobacter sp. DSM 9736 TaxID=1277350 RepID=UPI000B50BCF5|nr:VWA-like domain-containing protein [Geobacter sp. DSM 9736]SNB47866.1 Predicted metal-dependent peptidase [Geobacter sp. DSM 9736]